MESHYSGAGNRPFKRRKYRARNKPFIAYDLETTRIDVGTPKVKYLTAYGEDFKLSTRIDPHKDIENLLLVLENRLLIPQFEGYRFIAWNGNGYDVFFVAQALLKSDNFILMPYLTRSKNLRGLRVKGINECEGMTWEFLDGMSMTGLDTVKMKLSKFLGLFAPEYKKLDLDFDLEEFDPDNPDHVAYADRDSEGLYYAMHKCSEIARELTGNDLQPTMGNLAIKYFQSKVPEGVTVWKAPEELQQVLHGPAKRGGYCWVAKQYQGPVWKFDINQAYAGAMRDCDLPAGSCVRTEHYEKGKCGVYLVTISRSSKSKVPFYYRDAKTNAGLFTIGEETTTYLLSTEIDHLRKDKWKVRVDHGFYWEESFRMKEMVDELESLRYTDPEGPSGPLGTMVKVIGNSAYGKTLEVLEGMELIMAKEKPDDYDYYMPEMEGFENVFYKQGEPFSREYHQPQIGCFITAHVRLVVRHYALADADHFIYADTDCLVFSRDVNFLEINPTRYGAWKRETDGKDYIIIGKKVYWGEDDTLHAKGLRVRELSKKDFEAWLKGQPPTQRQIQRNNFVKVIAGQEMFKEMDRRGTDVTKSKQVRLNGKNFEPF